MAARVGVTIGARSTIPEDVQEAKKQLESEVRGLSQIAKTNKIQLQLDLSRVADGDKKGELNAQINYYEKQLESQKAKLAALSTSYKSIAASQGEASRYTVQANNAFMRQETYVNNLSKSLDRYKANLVQVEAEEARQASRAGLKGVAKDAGSAVLNTLTAGGSMGSALLSGAQTGGSSLITMLKNIPGPAKIAAGVLVAVGVAINKMSEYAKASVQSGDNTYRMMQRLGASAGEVGKMSRMAGDVNVDMNTLSSAMARLNGAMINGTSAGKRAESAIEAFGGKLRNSDGSMKNYSQELEAIATAYHHAQQAGKEQEFLAALGPRFQELIPLLEQYHELAAADNRIVKADNSDPKKMHEIALAEREANKQTGQLKAQIGNATAEGRADFSTFEAAASAVLLRLIQVLGNAVNAVKKFIEECKPLKTVAGWIGSAFESVLGTVIPGGHAILAEYHKMKDEQQKDADNSSNSWDDGKNYKNVSLGSENDESSNSSSLAEKEREDTQKREQYQQELTQSYERATQYRIEAAKSEYAATHTAAQTAIYDIKLEEWQVLQSCKTEEERAAAVAKFEAQIRAEYKKSADAAKRVNESFQDKIFHLEHSDKENQKYDLFKEIKAGLADGLDAQLAANYASDYLQKNHLGNYNDWYKQYYGGGNNVNDYSQQQSQRMGNNTGKSGATINLNMGTVVTPDSDSMANLADMVADKITPEISAALGGTSNGY